MNRLWRMRTGDGEIRRQMVFPGKGCWLLPADDRCCQVPKTAVLHQLACFNKPSVTEPACDTMIVTCLRQVMSADYA